ncbi:MAG: ComEA family DNA-binding protein, partial [Oscillospiraceae bacterium]
FGAVSTVSTAETETVININTASSLTLQKLNGIGLIKARAIVEYREKNGAFTSVDELVNVKGIGKATLEKIRNDITV